MQRKRRLTIALWEAGCVIWVCFAGSLLHFAFELTGYWKPMALLAAVNESAWEHTKMYFWPGLIYALVQYTYTRGVANNYWLGKAVALALTPLAIFALYYAYMAYVDATGGTANLAVMLAVMIFGIGLGQLASYRILTLEPLSPKLRRSCAAATYATLLLMFSTLTYFPPKIFVFENFYCYRYTGEYGILENYAPYRVFLTGEETGGGINYCDNRAPVDTTPADRS